MPVLTPEKSLFFVYYEKGDALSANQYGIGEPENKSRIIPTHQLDLVIAPLVAFDAHGNRLGTGGGYYDRTFAFLHENKRDKPSLLGLAYLTQSMKTLPLEPWDIPLDGVITEQAFIEFSSSQP